jgi:hypothetical protein
VRTTIVPKRLADHACEGVQAKMEWDFRRALQVAAAGIARAWADKEKEGRKRRKEEEEGRRGSSEGTKRAKEDGRLAAAEG